MRGRNQRSRTSAGDDIPFGAMYLVEFYFLEVLDFCFLLERESFYPSSQCTRKPSARQAQALGSARAAYLRLLSSRLHL